MSITRHHTNQRMSQIVMYNQTVYLAGQVADDETADIKVQTRSTLAKVDSLLEQAGSSKDKLLTVTIYLRDIKDFAAMNEIWDAWVPEGQGPARACVEARLADPGLLVEICVTAALS